MKIASSFRVLITALALATTTQAIGAPILQVNNGLLTGAKNVLLDGEYWDVTFVGANCAAFFDGCDDTSDFPITDINKATRAARALLDQVFVDGSEGNFDTEVTKTIGCTSNFYCGAAVPFRVTERDGVARILALNLSPMGGEDGLAYSLTGSGGQGVPGYEIYARFTPTAVPEPSSIALMGLAMTGLALARRRRC